MIYKLGYNLPKAEINKHVTHTKPIRLESRNCWSLPMLKRRVTKHLWKI
jgi:hypothetical protein